MHQQMRHFLEAGVIGQILDVVTAVMQVIAAAADSA